MSLGEDYRNDYAYELHNGGKLPLEYPNHNIKTESIISMNKIIEEVKLMGEPWKSTNGNLLYTFGIKYKGGGKAVANSTSDSPWWGMPDTEVVEVPKGTTTKSGCPKVKYDRPEAEASIATGHMASSGGSGPAKGVGRDVGVRVGASIKFAVEALAAAKVDPTSESYEDSLLDTAKMMWRISESLTEFVTAPPPAEEKAEPTNPEDEEF